jgi:hypothetical protein
LQSNSDSLSISCLKDALQQASLWLAQNHPIVAISYNVIGVLCISQGRSESERQDPAKKQN